MNKTEFQVGKLALELVPAFTGRKEESAKLFIDQLEEAFYLAKVKDEKYKQFYFERKLQGLSLQWYESLLIDNYKTWDLLKRQFIREFERAELRLQYINERLIKIHQNVEENESVKAFSYRLIKLFNEYRQAKGRQLVDKEKVGYFIKGLFPYYKQILNNLYQEQVGLYVDCLFEDVLTTALKLEANHKVFEEECRQLQELGLAENIRVNVNVVQYDRKTGDFNKSDKSNNGEERISFQEEGVSFDDQLISIASSFQDVKDETLIGGETVNGLSDASGTIDGEDKLVEFNKVINNFETDYNINKEGDQEVKVRAVDYSSLSPLKNFPIEVVVNDRKSKMKIMNFKEIPSDSYLYCDLKKDIESFLLNKDEKRVLMLRKEPNPPLDESEFVVGDRRSKMKVLNVNESRSGFYNNYTLDEGKGWFQLNKAEERMIMSEKEPKPPWIEIMLTDQEVKREET